MSILVSLFGFNILILAHEFGHFLVARWLGVHARLVSVGFGPPLLEFQSKITTFRLGLLPLGGYVRFDQPEGVLTPQMPDAIHGFEKQRRYKRILIALGGPLANVLLAVIIYSALFATHSAVVYRFHREQTPYLVAVDDHGKNLGIHAGDLIVALDGESVSSFAQVASRLSSDAPEVHLTLSRGASDVAPSFRKRETRVEGLVLYLPQAGKSDQLHEIILRDRAERLAFIRGAMPMVARFGATSLSHAFVLGSQETLEVVRMMGLLVEKWVDGSETPAVQSVVKMTQASARSFERGWSWFLSLFALFSMNLAVLNLLPLPGLDGGRICLDGVEAIIGQPISVTWVKMIHAVGLLVLLGFVFAVMLKELFELVF